MQLIHRLLQELLGKTVLYVNGSGTKNMSDQDVARLITGPVGTSVELCLCPGRHTLGSELPTHSRNVVRMTRRLSSPIDQHPSTPAAQPSNRAFSQSKAATQSSHSAGSTCGAAAPPPAAGPRRLPRVIPVVSLTRGFRRPVFPPASSFDPTRRAREPSESGPGPDSDQPGPPHGGEGFSQWQQSAGLHAG